MLLYSLFSFGLFASASFIGIGLAVWQAPSVTRVQRITRLLLLYCVVVSLAALATTIARALHFRPFGSAARVMNPLLIFRAWIPIGAALVGMAGVVTTLGARRRVAARASVQTYITSPELLQALCISASLSFFAVEIGKLANDADMRRFFQDSHLPVWLHYVTMAIETIGAVALLSRSRRVPAALGLGAIMIAAIGTHARNGDPFTDSLEALHLLLLLACVAVIGAFARRTSSTPSGPSATPPSSDRSLRAPRRSGSPESHHIAHARG